MPFDSDESLNGISRIQAQAIYSKYSPNNANKIQTHLGGECIFVGADMGKFKDEIRSLWNYNSKLGRMNGEFLPTEEHLLSVLCPKYEYKPLNFLVSRIWTGFRYRLVPSKKEIEELSLLHLPAEKSKGFSQFFWLVSTFPRLFMDMNDEVFRYFVTWKFHLNSTSRVFFFRTYSFFQSFTAHSNP
jgi:hypothetical protein